MTRSRLFALGRKGAVAISDQTVFSGAGLLVSLLLARWLGVTEFGAYSYAWSVMMLVSGVHQVLVEEPATILGPVRYPKRLASFLKTQTMISFLTSGCCAAALLILGVVIWLANGRRDTGTALIASALATIGVFPYWFARRSAYIQGRPLLALARTSVYASALLGLTASMYAAGVLQVATAYGGLFVAGLLAARLRIAWAGAARHDDDSGGPAVPLRDVLLANWRYGRVLVLQSLLYWLCGNAYVVMTGELLGIDDAGALRALQLLVTPVTQIQVAMNLVFLPSAASRLGSGGVPAFQHFALRFSCVLATIAVAFIPVLWMFGAWLVGILYGAKYDNYVHLLPLLGALPVITALSSIWMSGLRMRDAALRGLAVDALGALIFLGAGPWLIRRYGIDGAAIGLVLSSVARLPLVVLLWLWPDRGRSD